MILTILSCVLISGVNTCHESGYGQRTEGLSKIIALVDFPHDQKEMGCEVVAELPSAYLPPGVSTSRIIFRVKETCGEIREATQVSGK